MSNYKDVTMMNKNYYLFFFFSLAYCSEKNYFKIPAVFSRQGLYKTYHFEKKKALILGNLSTIKLHNRSAFEDIADCAHNSDRSLSASTVIYLKDNPWYSCIVDERDYIQKALFLDKHRCWHIVDPTGQWKDDFLEDQPGWRYN